jgi:hypothetical protein
MNNLTIVCPDDFRLIAKFQRTSFVVWTKEAQRISDIEREVTRDNHLHAIWIKTERVLSDIIFQPNWEGIPLVVSCPNLGHLDGVWDKIDLLRKLKLHVFLPASKSENFTGVRILASLGIPSGVQFDETIDWDLTNDLMHYAVYSKTNHAPVEPFHYAVTRYEPNRLMDIRVVYFEKPFKYLHINEKEEIALTNTELDRGESIAIGVESIKTIEDNKTYKDRKVANQKVFLERQRCAYCDAWRICGGIFTDTSMHDNRCSQFFSDLLEAAEYTQKQKEQRREFSWQ